MVKFQVDLPDGFDDDHEMGAAEPETRESQDGKTRELTEQLGAALPMVAFAHHRIQSGDQRLFKLAEYMSALVNGQAKPSDNLGFAENVRTGVAAELLGALSSLDYACAVLKIVETGHLDPALLATLADEAINRSVKLHELLGLTYDSDALEAVRSAIMKLQGVFDE